MSKSGLGKQTKTGGKTKEEKKKAERRGRHLPILLGPGRLIRPQGNGTRPKQIDKLTKKRI